MRCVTKCLALLVLVLAADSAGYGATIAGTVKGPDGAPFEGAFVQAREAKTRITTMVLSDKQGRYRADNLAAGAYRIQIKAVGYTAEPQNGVNLSANQNASFDFALKQGTVHWNDLSIYQADKLLPAGAGKDKLFTRCFICHGFQTRMASVTRDAEGWRDRVEYMRESMRFSLSWRFTDSDAEIVSTYLTSLFGPDSILPKSPAELPQYKDTVRSFPSEAMNIVYVEYDMPGPNRFPFSAAPDSNGDIWIPNFGVANKISKLDPKTGAFTDYPAPNVGTAAIHAAYPAPDGSVWLTEQASNKLGRWDPVTKTITEYQDSYLPGQEGEQEGGSRHTVRVDPGGNIWSSGYPLARFDPETKTYKDFWDDAAHTYSLVMDKAGDVWFTDPGTGEIGKADWQTLKVTKYMPPTGGSYEHRIDVGEDGIVWFGEYGKGKIGRFDPKTKAFKEYDVPGGAKSYPYALVVGPDKGVWFSSYYIDTINRLDPDTGKITEYPFPHSENTLREFFVDAQGRIWWGSPSNNKVGYFYLAPKR